MLVVVVALALLLAGCAHDGGRGSGGGRADASCASLLEYNGHTYAGYGELNRDPSTTGRVGTGTRLGCDDGNGGVPDRKVEVTGLAHVPAEQAVLVDGSLFVRRDQSFPELARRLFTATSCATSGPHEYVGATIWIRATTDTGPGLGAKDVETSG